MQEGRTAGSWKAGDAMRTKVHNERMSVRAYPMLVRCIEEGVAYGYRRAHKHTDLPTEEGMQEEIAQAVLSSICEYFAFEEPK